MREILLRGKRIDNGEWIEGAVIFGNSQFCPGRAYICPALFAGKTSGADADLLLGGFEQIDPETVGQYTGLTDKNGVKIFEGDILKSANIFVVGFEDGSIVLRFEKNGLEYAHEHYLDEMLVIGNIYDNPELLEE